MIKNKSVTELKSGDITAKDIYTSNGNLLIEKDTALNDKTIQKLENRNIHFVSVYAPDLKIEKEIQDSPSPKARRGINKEAAVALKQSLKKGEELKKETLNITKQIMDNLKLKKEIDRKSTKQIVSKLIDESTSNEQIIFSLLKIKTFDNYLFNHSVNVSTLSILTGCALGLSRDELHIIGEAALLHDIGMTVLPLNLWNKNGILTEEERFQIEKHPVLSADVIEKIPNADVQMVKAVYQHHEREDGSGYPKGIKGDKISLFAKIMAVTDSYDAMVNERPYKRRVMPYQSMKEIIKLANISLNQPVVKSFINNMSLYPVGSVIMLNTKETGVVITANKNAPLRPVLRLIKSADNKFLEDEIYIDLTKDRNLFIKECIFDESILEKILESGK